MSRRFAARFVRARLYPWRAEGGYSPATGNRQPATHTGNRRTCSGGWSAGIRHPIHPCASYQLLDLNRLGVRARRARAWTDRAGSDRADQRERRERAHRRGPARRNCRASGRDDCVGRNWGGPGRHAHDRHARALCRARTDRRARAHQLAAATARGARKRRHDGA